MTKANWWTLISVGMMILAILITFTEGIRAGAAYFAWSLAAHSMARHEEKPDDTP